jgi:diacylglycerol kinase (ATP)
MDADVPPTRCNRPCVLISANPQAGARSGSDRVGHLTALLAEQGYRVETVTDEEELARRAASLWKEGQLRCVVAAGGDGTASYVVNLLPAGIPVVLLPLGTENLLAKYLGISGPQEACAAILRGETCRFDAGTANGRLFLLMVSCGLDADVVHRLHRTRRGHIRHLSYAKPIVDSLRSYQYPELTITCRGGPPGETAAAELEIAARWAFVLNFPQYARGLQFAPSADAADGLLDVCTFKSGSLLSSIRYLAGVVLGWHQGWSDCVSARAREIRIESSDAVPFQLDGDPGGTLPVEIRIEPGRLALLVPPHRRIPQPVATGVAAAGRLENAARNAP